MYNSSLYRIPNANNRGGRTPDFLKLKQKLLVGFGLIILLIVIIFPVKALANSINIYGTRNMFYVETLNYALPIVKVTSFQQEDMVENKFSIKESMLNLFGINIRNPISILNKEESCFSDGLKSEKKIQKPENLALSPYKLNDTSIAKDSAAASSTSASDNAPASSSVSVVDPSLVNKTLSGTPEIFIYHTHTSESYPTDLSQVSDILAGKRGATSSDQSQNVCAIGDALQTELVNNYKINVIHDKTIHDANAYNDSYLRSAVTVNKYLKQYGDFKIIIDLHRDSAVDRNSDIVKINGENVAKIMFVMSQNNPHYDKNMVVVNKIQAISNKLYPGLCKPVYLYPHGNNCFNQTKSNNAVLIEIGTDLTTVSECKNTTKYLARIIAQYLNGKN